MPWNSTQFEQRLLDSYMRFVLWTSQARLSITEPDKMISRPLLSSIESFIDSSQPLFLAFSINGLALVQGNGFFKHGGKGLFFLLCGNSNPMIPLAIACLHGFTRGCVRMTCTLMRKSQDALYLGNW